MSQLSLSDRKSRAQSLFDQLAPERQQWLDRNGYFYAEDERYLQFLIPQGLKVLELGCGIGQSLASLQPSEGVGVDFSVKMIEQAQKNYPHLHFQAGDIEDENFIKSLSGPFDVIVLSDTIGLLDDCQQVLDNLQALCHDNTRIVIAYYSHIWEPVLKLAEKMSLKMPQIEQNWLSTEDIKNLLKLTDYDPIKQEWRTLLPRRAFGIGTFVNRFLATLPLIRRLCVRNFVVARPTPKTAAIPPSTTVIVPCRNEKGNIEAAVTRTPRFCDELELLFIEGGSQDGTFEEIERVIQAYPEYDIKVLKQDGKGKGDAVRKGFDHASGDILMILDADLTMPPEMLPKFYQAMAQGKGEFINGTRLVYPMEKQAMRFLNLLANHTFSRIFSWLLNQRFTDTLCGTKVLSKTHYQQIADNRAYFGEFDPFGDFDLIFGAAKLNLKIVEVPIRYAARSYGETQISRFRHGVLLLRMVAFAYRKLKAF